VKCLSGAAELYGTQRCLQVLSLAHILCRISKHENDVEWPNCTRELVLRGYNANECLTFQHSQRPAYSNCNVPAMLRKTNLFQRMTGQTCRSRSTALSLPRHQYIIISQSYYLPNSVLDTSAGQQRTGPYTLDKILRRAGRSPGAASQGHAAASTVRELLP
jgi:hypothetical protein